ncbi:MAG: hypothetical protein ACR2MM_04980 [Flavobacteriaceae bacterium]
MRNTLYATILQLVWRSLIIWQEGLSASKVTFPSYKLVLIQQSINYVQRRQIRPGLIMVGC